MVVVRRKINVMYWNARSIRNKILEVYNFMNENEIDVAAIQETNLNDEIKLRGNSHYKIIRLDRETNDDLNDNTNIGGGVLFIIRKEIDFDILPHLNTEIIEALAIKLRLSDIECTLVSTYYPGTQVQGDLIKFKRDILKLFSLNGPFLLVGDFNCRHTFWTCSQSNGSGRILYDMMCSNPIQIIFPPEHTFYPGDYPRRNSSLLDIVVTNALIPISPLQTSDALPSDHRAVLFSINEELHVRDTPCMKYDYMNANWPAFQNILHNEINLNEYSVDSLISTSAIDNAVDFLSETILNAERQAVPTKTTTFQDFCLSSTTLQMIRVRKSLLRSYRRNRNPALKPEINHLTRMIRFETDLQINEKFTRTVENLNQSDQNHAKLWKLTKNLKKKNDSIPVLKSENRKAFTDMEKAELLSEEVEKAHLLTHTPSRNKKIDKDVKMKIRQLSSREAVIPDSKHVTATEIRNHIKSFKNKKAPGFDSIKNILLKNLPNKAIILICNISNACLKLSYFPTKLKKAIILAFKKAGKDPTKPANYRPISLLSTLGKILEKCILARMTSFMEENQILNNEQFGFRKGHSCAHQILRIKKYIRNGITRKRSVGMITLDCERAFDTVWHDGLIFKLDNMNFPSYLTKIVLSYLKNRTFQVRVNASLSEARNVKAGVPQGGILSPVLYTLFVADIPTPRDCFIGQYADDTALLTTAYRGKTVTKRLQKGHHTLLRHFVKWKIKLNISKYEACYFTRRRKEVYKPPESSIVIEGNAIEWKPAIKYLGVHIDSKLTFKAHTNNSISKVEKYIKILYPLINRRSRLTIKTKVLLYKSIFRPVLTYAAPVWSSCALVHRKRLQITQNKILKMMLNVPMYTSTSIVQDETETGPIIDYIQELTNNFFARTASVENPEVLNILD